MTKSAIFKVYTISLGCPKNRVDTERMLGQVREVYQPAQELEDADLIVINTCAFIQPAVEESVQTILELAQTVQNLPHRPLLLVTGCLPARYGEKELARELPEVDIWLPLQEQDRFGACLAGHFDLFPSGPSRLLTTAPGFAYLKISEGCEHRCAFCTIPAIRGPLRSESMTSLLAEARHLRDQGARELCLVAQDVTAFGRDAGQGKTALPRLLEGLCTMQGIDWVRLMYLYPTGLSQNLLTFMARAGPPLLPYIDVPLQHAHPDILAGMGRPFAQDPRRIVDRVKTCLPEACLRTSLIVGYPGETEHHFQSVLDFVQEVGFWHVGVFAFCSEEGTKAAKLPHQVPDQVKAERREELMRVQAEISRERMAGFTGQTHRVLLDQPDPEWPTLFQGRSWFQAPEVDGLTYVSSQTAAPGDMVWAEVVDSMDYDLSALDVGRDGAKDLETKGLG